MKRILYVVIGIVVIAAIAFALWFFVFQGPATANNPGGSTGSLPYVTPQGGAGSQGTGNVGTPGGSPSANASGTSAQFGLTSNEQVLDYFVDAQNNIFDLEPNGEIAEIVNGQAAFLSSSAIDNLIRAAFSFDGTMALVNFGDPSNPQSSFFNLKAKSWSPLPAGLTSPSWSPVDDRIAYLTHTGITETLATLDLSKVNAKPVTYLSLDAQDLNVQWLNQNQVVLFDKPSAYTVGSAWLFDLQKKVLTPIVTEWPGFESTWTGALIGTTTPIGLVFQSTAYDRGGTLQLIHSDGSVVQNLNFLTLPSKCLFNDEWIANEATTTLFEGGGLGSTASSSGASSITKKAVLFLYCAVPTDQSSLSLANLPDDYNQMSLFTVDQIYKIDTSDGQVTSILPNGSINFDATDLRVFNNILFFVNRYDRKLYAISLTSRS